MAGKDPLKTLKIKTGIVKRMVKERNMYILEVEENEAKVEKMKQEGKDEYTIKKANEVLEESRAMVPDSSKRLERATRELQDVVEEFGNDLCETEEYKAAKQCLEELAEG